MEYFGVYYNAKYGSWAWRVADYYSDEAALTHMKTLALNKKNEDGEEGGLVFYNLTHLKRGNKVVFNG